jgi:hypothetical protein
MCFPPRPTAEEEIHFSAASNPAAEMHTSSLNPSQDFTGLMMKWWFVFVSVKGHVS